ncbi:hypothetical protein E3J79_04080 [Candidatus Dependentiae bacterium]|nr:MAG: hypothetical protein E3J79_04080 [Candidatus Dependentiae bacterium]
MNSEHLYAVILAGGCSERLWPLSRQCKPKQFLSIDNKKTLLEQTIDRISSFINIENIWISTTKNYKKMVLSHTSAKRLIIEPCMRNTAPSVILACLKLIQQDPDATIIFVPTDSFIPDEEKEFFVHDACIALDFANKFDCITLLGVKPTYPATGYGYIEYVLPSDIKHKKPLMVKQFHEKPSIIIANSYVNKENMLWNSGVICAKASVIIEEFKALAPDMYESIQAYLQGGIAYSQVRSDSIDYVLLEKSKYIYVLPVDFSWCDIGSIATFVTLKNQYADFNDKLIAIKSHNNNIEINDDTLTVLIGVDDLCIIKTADVLLIVKKDHAEQVREILAHLRQHDQEDYL